MISENINDFKNGEPYIFEEETVKNHICCDCGLVHFIHVGKVTKKKIITYWYRDNYETERLREEK